MYTGKTDDKADTNDAIFAAMGLDSVKVDKLVQEYLTAQSLKIIPQAPFSDAISQFVDKNDKHAMEQFVDLSLKDQVKDLLAMEREEDDDDLDDAMEQFREKQEEAFRAGIRKIKSSTRYRPRPEGWDSDLEGEWEDQPAARIYSDNEEEATPAPAAKRGRAAKPAVNDVDDDDESIISAPTKKAPAKRAPAAKKTPAPKKAAPVKPKAPAKTPARGRGKKAVPEPSDDEDEDVIMLDDDEPPPKAQPKRAAATRGRQTQLNFSQAAASSSQLPRTQTQRGRELSHDVIEDEDDEDAFEPMVSSARRR